MTSGDVEPESGEEQVESTAEEIEETTSQPTGQALTIAGSPLPNNPNSTVDISLPF